jgi:hypothetical protein
MYHGVPARRGRGKNGKTRSCRSTERSTADPAPGFTHHVEEDGMNEALTPNGGGEEEQPYKPYKPAAVRGDDATRWPDEGRMSGQAPRQA